MSLGDDYNNNFNSPAEEWLPKGLETVLGTQALFPLTAQFEMAGNPKENEVAGAVHDRIDYVWPILAKRVRTIPEYGEMFSDVFEDVDTAEQVTIAHIGEALAAFIALEFGHETLLLTLLLLGMLRHLLRPEKGMDLFYGKAKCASCHSGPLLQTRNFMHLPFHLWAWSNEAI